MPVNFGFSYTGLIFLLCLFIPNILYARRLPADLPAVRENRVLLACERAGQALCTVLMLIFRDLNPHGLELWLLWLLAAGLLLTLYLICWGRFFRGGRSARDFYRPFAGIPLPLAVLPVTAALCLAVYGRNLWLGIAALILGVGHIGITAQNAAAFAKR